MIVLDFDDSLNDQAARFQDIKDFRLRSNVEDDVVRLIFNLIKLLIELDQINEAPLLKERKALQELLSS